ncbi:serine hydrolase [Neolewinella agarilytica]|uniref:Beta-lactamase enzyme family protein n=1 Tax=Neolewinella agarilytica TaxID=478744 RepID=A0A1H9LLB4_9BACT|nr:serine hydrolase [Neolewinella agarilytica]SER11683.1 Beta-lactamase enzyme family protein [Neolewinella agarilytica]
MKGSVAFLLFLLSVMLHGQSGQSNPLNTIISRQASSFGPWASEPDKYEIQVLYTEIDRQPDGSVRLKTHRWGARDTSQYFYPASTVKMPAAILALQQLNELGVQGLSPQTLLFHGTGTAPASAPQTPAAADTTSVSGYPSLEQYIRKIFLVSDNDAYNRLFEFLGPTYMNHALHRAGIHGGRLQHRVGVGGFNTETHAWLNPVKFVDGINVPYQIGERHDRYYDPLPNLKGQFRGKGYTTNDGELINEPFDFSHKNYLSVRNLHDILLRVVLPEAVPEQQRFTLTDADYALLRQAMSERPRESASPVYDKPDNYVKFWLYGDQPEATKIPDGLRIYNKVGWAYGYLTDAAYITDAESGREFMLVGTIHVNNNRIFNDGEYEYLETGMPFFGELGRAVLAFERGKR